MLAQIQKFKQSRPPLDLSSEVVAVAASFLSSSTCKIDFTATDLETFAYGEWKISKGAMRLGLLMRIVGIQIANDTIDPSTLSLELVADHATLSAGRPNKLSLDDELALVAAGVVFFAFGAVVVSVKDNTQLAIVRRLVGIPTAAHAPLATPGGQYHTGLAAALNAGIMETTQTRDTVEHHLLYFLVTLEQTVAPTPGKRKREESTMASATVAPPTAPPPAVAGSSSSPPGMEEEELARPIETYGTFPNNCTIELPKLGGRTNMLKDSAAARLNAVAVRARTSMFVQDKANEDVSVSWKFVVDFGSLEAAASAQSPQSSYEVTFLRGGLPAADEATALPIAKKWRDLKKVLVDYRQITDRSRANFRLQAITSQNDNSARQNDVFAPIRKIPPPKDEVAFVDAMTPKEVIIRVTKKFFPTRGVAIDTVVQYMLCSHIGIGPTLYGACIFEEVSAATSRTENATFGVILVLQKLAGSCDDPIKRDQDDSAESQVRASGILYALEQASRHGLLYMDSKLGNFFRERSLELPSQAFQDMMREQRAGGLTNEERVRLQKEGKQQQFIKNLEAAGKRSSSKKKKGAAGDDMVVDAKNMKNVRLIDLDGTYSFIVPIDSSSSNGFKPIYYVNLALFYFALRVDETQVSKTVSYHLGSLATTAFRMDSTLSGNEIVKQTSLDDRLIAMGQHLRRSMASDESSQMQILSFVWKGGRFGLDRFTTNQLERPGLQTTVVNADIKQFIGATTAESTAVDANGNAVLQTYMDAIKIGMARQIDFRAVESPMAHIRDRLGALFDLSWMHFADTEVSGQGEATSFVSKMQVAQRLSFIEKEAQLRDFIFKNVKVAKLVLKKRERPIIEILQLVASPQETKHTDTNARGFLAESGSAVVDARNQNKNFRLEVVLPVYKQNEEQIWGDAISTLYDLPPPPTTDPLAAGSMDTSTGP